MAKVVSRRKKAENNILIMHVVVVVIATFLILHAVHVRDVTTANAALTGAKPVRGFGALIQGVIEAVKAPFDFKGLIFKHALAPLGFFLVLYGLTAYRMKIDRELNRNTNWWKGYPYWFGEDNVLLPSTTTFVLGRMVEVKNKKTGEKEQKFKESRVTMNDWEGYQKYIVAPYTEEDKAVGRPDPNVLIGRFPESTGLTGDVKFAIDPGITARNLLTLVIGGSGTGKTFKYLEPNLAQMNCSFVVTDPSGEIYENMGKMLLEDGYRVWRFSTTDLRYSNCYNPLDYIYDIDGNPDQMKITRLVMTFMNSSKTKGAKGGDQFWEKSATAWLTFAVIYVADFMPPEQRNFYQIMKLAQLGKSDEESSSSLSQLDKLIEQARKMNPKSKCFEYYDVYSIAPAKTRNSILISIGVDLAPFAQDALCNVTSTSYVCKRDKHGLITEYMKDGKGNYIKDSTNLDLRTLGDEKTALFLVTATADDPYQFLISLMYSQLFELLYRQAEEVAKNSWHIFGGNGLVLTSQYPTKEEAEAVKKLYAEAEVKTLTVGGVDHYYIFNKEAGKKYTLPEKYYEKKSGNPGWMREVYSEEVGNKMINEYKVATVKHGGLKLPMHTRLLLDEFANISEIPNFDQYLATMRKYQISCTIILQTISQLRKIYDKSTPTMIGNCDTIIFLGSPDVGDTCKTLSETFGKTVYKIVKQSQSRSNNGGSISSNYDIKEQDLISPSQLASLSDDMCIVKIRGYKPMRLLKLSLAQHPNYLLTGAAPELAHNKLLQDFTEAHYKCLPKQMARSNKIESLEETSSQVMNHESPLYGNGAKKRSVTFTRPGKPVRNKKEFAEAMETTEDKLDEVLKKPHTITAEERNDTASVQVAPIPNNDFEFKTESSKQNKNTNSSASASATAPAAGPNIDDTWLFM